MAKGKKKSKVKTPKDKNGVRDAKAEKIYLKMKQNKILTEVHMEASDGTEINMGWLKHYFAKKVAHLPEEERIAWMARKNKYIEVMNKCNAWKNKAYGFDNRVMTPDKKLTKKVSKNKFITLKKREDAIIELFGKMFSIKEVHEVCVMDWKLKVSQRTLSDFRSFHMTLIQEKIEDFKRGHADIRLGLKRSRLEELCWMYHECKIKMKEQFSRTLIETMKNLLESIKREVEGDKIVIDGNLDVNVETVVNSHLKNEALKGISIRQIIIGRVAAKMDLSAENLVASLTRSYYAKYSPLVNEESYEDADYAEIIYPSTQEYDFEQIEAKQGELIEAANEQKKAVLINRSANAKKAKKSDVKARILEKLGERREEIKQKRTLLDNIVQKHRSKK
jgi:hypothetical protein